MSLAERVMNGDILAAARLMRDIEDRVPSAREVLRELYANTGRAYLIGVTGSPGAGKSTIVDKMASVFRGQGKSVGIVAVDPSSPFTGGAILGDRIRMQRHAMDDGVFIRSVANRGDLGGLSRCTHDIVSIMDAMGKEIILIETVGVGQAEVDIAETAYTSIVVLVPGMGDDIQALKAGIIEIADIFVINKCDRDGADRAELQLRLALEVSSRRQDGWELPIYKTEAVSEKGIPELVSGIYRHKQMLERSSGLDEKRRKRTKAILRDILEAEMKAYFDERLEKDGEWLARIDALMEGRGDPYSVVGEIMAKHLNGRRS
jgi:LAO/AO transport system kinase